jgi:hypothetical protein
VKAETVCVLTGDIVRSSALGRDGLGAVFEAIDAAAAEVLHWSGGLGPERFRGDGWQLLIEDPALALRAMLRLRAAVRAADQRGETRVAAGFGGASVDGSLADGSGEAFERAGRALDGLRAHRRFALAGAFEAASSRALANGMTAACDALSQRWTARQAEVFAHGCGPGAPTLKAIAGRLGVTPQTVQSHFARGGGPALIDAVEAFETAMHEQP